MTQKYTLLKKRVLVILKDSNKKGVFKIIFEALHFWIKKKEFPYFYFGKFLYRKTVTNYNDYLSSKQVDKITLSKHFHKFQYSALLRNKLAFALFMEKHNLPVPSLISYNFKSRFIYKSKIYTLHSSEELYDFFLMVLNHSGHASIFVKSTTEMGGTGCFLLTKKNLKSNIEDYGSYILTHDYIHQEVIKQHGIINTVYQHSVNTIRFDTYIDKNNKIHILSAFMRFGQGSSYLDNASSGGIYVSVDLEKGELRGKSHQLLKWGGNQLDKHPDSKVTFNGFCIPYFIESVALIHKAVAFIPDRIIGWDIAITKNGPVLVEGNDNNSFITPDIAFGGYLKHPLFSEILQEA